MSENRARFSVKRTCQVLGVSTSGYYAWLKRGPSARELSNERLKQKIISIHAASRGTYGVPRITAELRAGGERVGRARVARLMRMESLEGITRRRWRKTTIRDRRAEIPEDLVEREFKAQRPNQLWVADITYISTWTGFLFLAVVIDVFSRRVVGWAMADHLRTELILDALGMAAQQRQASDTIHHSDQGSQYTSSAFMKSCDQLGIVRSTGSVGDCYDNAMAESFFATLKCELTNRIRYPNQAVARLSIFNYIEGFYNSRRRHSSIGYLSPIEYERRHLAASCHETQNLSAEMG